MVATLELLFDTQNGPLGPYEIPHGLIRLLSCGRPVGMQWTVNGPRTYVS